MNNFQIGDFVKIVKKWRYYSCVELGFITRETTNYGIIAEKNVNKPFFVIDIVCYNSALSKSRVVEGEKNKIYYKAYTDEQKFESIEEEEMEFIS